MTAVAGDSLVRVLSPAPRDKWRSVLEASSEATIFHTPEWLDACCAAGGFDDASRLYETGDGRQIIVPMVRAPRPMLQTTWSMPDGWGFGGAIGPGQVVPEDVAIVLDDVLGTTPRLIVKPGPMTGGAWIAAPARERLAHTVHIVDIREGFGALWSNRFSSGTRNKIRKAQKEGVEVQWGTGGDLMKVHWDIYLRWTVRRAKERGVPVPVALALAKRRESLARFETIARCLGERCQVGIASIDGRPAASTIVLWSGAHAHYWRSASDQELVGRRYANYLLLARALEDAAERRYRYVDMGESGGVRSLIDFKEHFGAKPISHEELRFEPRIVTNAIRARDLVLRGASGVTLTGASRLRRFRAKTKTIN
jgi:hypothetical protein